MIKPKLMPQQPKLTSKTSDSSFLSSKRYPAKINTSMILCSVISITNSIREEILTRKILSCTTPNNKFPNTPIMKGKNSLHSVQMRHNFYTILSCTKRNNVSTISNARTIFIVHVSIRKIKNFSSMANSSDLI